MTVRVAVIVAFLACGFGACIAAAQSSGPIEFLKRLDRTLCQSSGNTKCKGKRRAGSAKPAPKSTAEPPGEAPEQTDVLPDEGDSKVLKPRLRPVAVTAPDIDVASQQTDAPIILPRLRPGTSVAAKKKDIGKVVIAVPPPVTTAKPKLPDEDELASNTCLKALKAAGASFVPAAQPVAASACEIRVPVKLAGLMADDHVVALPDQPLLACAFALRFAQWLDERGQPLAKATAGSSISRVYTGPGFDCRGRNGDISSKISEHGHGNAVDIERFRLVDGRELWVKDADNRLSASYGPLKALRQSACERFTTVLGPGSNTAHEEHFHFDLGKHGKSGTYVICQ